jgi:uncharacterized membrane protein
MVTLQKSSTFYQLTIKIKALSLNIKRVALIRLKNPSIANTKLLTRAQKIAQKDLQSIKYKTIQTLRTQK